MTDAELIARQAKQIEELSDEVNAMKEGAAKVAMEIYGVGGPLNDNVMGYTKQQLAPFHRIAVALGDGLKR